MELPDSKVYGRARYTLQQYCMAALYDTLVRYKQWVVVMTFWCV